VQRWWSIFFGAVLLAIFLLCVISPFVGWWLPRNVASFGGDVDDLFYVILWFTTFFFVLIEVLLVYAMYRYAYRPGHKAVYVEGNHRLELAWTIVPSAILLFIAFAQVRAWERIKYPSRMADKVEHVLEVSARQWEWRLRYPHDIDRYTPDDNDSAQVRADKLAKAQAWARRWSETPEADDLHLVNELHTWKDAEVKVYLKTQDVIHSLWLPNLRLKQDALPGKTIPVWFQAVESNVSFASDFNKETGRWREFTPDEARSLDWEFACAELCGGSHYRMRGRLYVHPDREDYRNWLEHMIRMQQSRTETSPGQVARNNE
jgi:cytochrome c oxidase subunit 2